MTLLRLAILIIAANAFGSPLVAQTADCIIRPAEVYELTSFDAGVLDTVLVSRGDTVSKGQIIARLDSQIQQSALELAQLNASNDAQLNAAEARAAYRQEELTRITALASNNVINKTTLAEAEIEARLADLELESARASMKLAEAELEQARIALDRRAIRSPADGVVVEVQRAPGEYAHEEAPVITLAEIDPLTVEAYLPLEFYPALSVGQAATVTVPSPFDIRVTAHVSAVDRVFDAASGTVGLTLKVDNPDHAIPSGIKCEMTLGRS